MYAAVDGVYSPLGRFALLLAEHGKDTVPDAVISDPGGLHAVLHNAARAGSTYVRLTAGSAGAAADVHGPRHGSVLAIEVFSGAHTLRLHGGRIVVFADSGAGTDLEIVCEDVHVTVIAGQGRRVTVRGITSHDNLTLLGDLRHVSAYQASAGVAG